MSAYGPDGDPNAQSDLSGPGSTGHASDPGGCGDAREGVERSSPSPSDAYASGYSPGPSSAA